MWTQGTSQEAFLNKVVGQLPTLPTKLIFVHGGKQVSLLLSSNQIPTSESPKGQNLPVWIIALTLSYTNQCLSFLDLTQCAKNLFGEESYMDAATLVEKFTYGGEKLEAQGNKVKKMQMSVLGGTTRPRHSQSIQ